jgi:hypothetical protein
MNLANTVRLMAEKKDAPPFDVSKADYAGAAKELTQYAKTKGGMDKDDFLSMANRMASIAKKKSPNVMAKFARDLGALDTSPREKVVSVMRNNGIKVTMGNRGLQIEEHDVEEWEELDEAKVQGKEVFDKTFANRTQADNFAKKNGGRVKQVGRVFYVFKEAPEDDEPASPDEGSMAMQQLEFIEYAADEIGEHIEKGGKFPEWMQNKLATVHDNMQSLHAQIDHEEIEDDEPEEMDEAYKTPSEAKAYEDGKKAVAKKVSYDDNPNKKGTKEYTAWSKGHNDARAKMIGNRFSKEEVELEEKFKVGDKVKVKKGTLKSPNQRHYETKAGTIVKDYKDGEFKINFGGNDDFSIEGKFLVKEEVELDEAVITYKYTSTHDSDHTDMMKFAKKNPKITAVRKGNDTFIKGERRDVMNFIDPMATFNIKNVVKEEVEEARDPSKSGGSGYDLYHKDFSSAMKHAYDYAKKKYGIEIDPTEIDDKVASGPRKPSSGKTNTYRLKGKDGKKAVQIQVSNLDNKKYELNMYKESVEMELDEAMRVLATKGKTKVVTKGDGVARVMVGNKEIASGDLDDGAGGWFMSKKGDKGQKFFDSPKKIADFYAEEVEMEEEINLDELFESAFEEEKLSLEDTLKAIWEGKKLDPVNKKALDKDFDDRDDKDLDNDGDVDDSDEYLHKRRKAVKKAISKQEDEPKGKVGKSNKQTKVDVNPSIEEEKGEEMTSAEMEKRDEIMKSLEKKKDEFVKKYGDRAKEVMARTAIKMAKKHA